VTYRWITLTTDYGLSDGFVAAVHGILGQRAPGARVLDVTHLVPPGDVTRGAAVLAQTVVHLPVAVHVAVVDPGVGSARRGVAIETGRGLLVGPDNGLLVGAAEALGGAARVVELTNSEWLAEAISATFHGRDVFAPVAARLATGAALAEAGPEIDSAELVRLPDPVVVIGDGTVEAEVVMVDRFGNVQLAAPGSALATLPTDLSVGGMQATSVATFADVPQGQLVAFTDSAGKLALAINGGRAAVALSLLPGDVVRICGR
jgi:S-adenosyl-L-methionine hydrolase (adenosine-forming)